MTLPSSKRDDWHMFRIHLLLQSQDEVSEVSQRLLQSQEVHIGMIKAGVAKRQGLPIETLKKKKNS